MKTLLLVGLMASSAQAVLQPVKGPQVLAAIEALNYDNDWTGKVPGRNQECRVSYDNYENNTLTVSNYYGARTNDRTFKLTEKTLFTKRQQGTKLIFTEFKATNNPYGKIMVVEIDYKLNRQDKSNSLATVTLRNSPEDIGISCTVSWDK